MQNTIKFSDREEKELRLNLTEYTTLMKGLTVTSILGESELYFMNLKICT